jgi:hypothetical protein
MLPLGCVGGGARVAWVSIVSRCWVIPQAHRLIVRVNFPGRVLLG